jgi:ABC-type lipoprotein release transport system permease subunit
MNVTAFSIKGSCTSPASLSASGGFDTGSKLAGVPVLPMPMLLVWAVGIALTVALLASYLPARRAAHLDPCATLQEV